MTSETKPFVDDPDFARDLALLKLEKLWCIVNKDAFQKLPATAQAASAHADWELLRLLPVSFTSAKEVFVFTTERGCVAALQKFRKRPEFNGKSFTSILVSPVTLVEKMKVDVLKTLHINQETEGGFTIPEERLDLLVRISALLRYIDLKRIVIAQDGTGYAYPVELEGKNLAMIFLSERTAEATLTIIKNDCPKAVMKVDNLSEILEAIMPSEFEGLVFSPGSETEFILKKEDIPLLIAMRAAESGHSIASKLFGVLGR